MNWLNDQQSVIAPILSQNQDHYNHHNNRDQITERQQSISPFGTTSQPKIYCYNIPETYNQKTIQSKNNDFDSQFGSEENQIKQYLQRRTQRQYSVMQQESQYHDGDEIQPMPIPMNLSLIQKSSLAKRIQEMAMKKNDNNNIDTISVSTNDQNINIEEYNGQFMPQKRKRKIITVQILQQLKKVFKQYSKNSSKNYKGKLSFRIISEKVQISIAEVKCLYQEYLKDNQFTQRMIKLNQKANNQLNNLPMGSNNSLTNKRIRFIQALVRQKGSLTTHQIVEQMSHIESLHNVDKNGQKMPITRRLVQHLMTMRDIKPKKVPFAARNINTYDCIHNRFRYAAKYLDLTDDKASDICFVGQFSFVNNLSLSSCPIMKRDSFVDIRYIRGEPKPKIDGKLKSDIKAETGTGNPDDRYGRNLQYLIVLSLHGVIYYELYYDIFQQMKLSKTLQNIGKAMKTRNPNQKKYLILETSFFHKKADLQKFQRKSHIKVVFLPANTPMLNPTQYLFNQVKQLVKSKSYKIKRPYASVLTQTLETLKQKNMQSYYTCIRPYLQLALKQEPFK